MSESVIRNPPSVDVEEVNEAKRLYTHCIVSYASREELQPLLNQTKHYALIHHDILDATSSSPHYHILATFEREKSFTWVRKQVVSAQNTFTESIKGDVEDVIRYFQHIDDASVIKGKTAYSFDKIEFDNKAYWLKRIKSGEKEENPNDTFVDDLISDDYNVQNMARKYGRDFLKNLKSYEYARERMLFEMGELKHVNQLKQEKRRLEEAIALLSEYNNL